MAGYTWSEIKTKAQRMAQTKNADILTQLENDINEGYGLFNAKLSRYFTRKQQFTDLIAGQGIYQLPIDCVRITGITAFVTPTYEPPVQAVRSEEQWRQIVSVRSISTNWPTFYFAIGNDQIAIWPTPSQDVENGMRLYYQPTTGALSVDDVTSVTTGYTVTVTNGSVTVTASGSAFSTSMAGLWFQLTSGPDQTWYEIISATATELTLKTPYVAVSQSGAAWRVAQLSIIPQQYQDAPVHYALWSFFSAQGNEGRAEYHRQQFDRMVDDCRTEYSSSNESSVITFLDDLPAANIWLAPPPVGY